MHLEILLPIFRTLISPFVQFPRVSLSKTPLSNADLKLFFNGTISIEGLGGRIRWQQNRFGGYQVIVGKLPSNFCALTKACKHAAGQLKSTQILIVTFIAMQCLLQ